MNAIILEPISATLSPSAATTTLVLHADETVGWKTEAQRLARGQPASARTTAVSADRLAEVSTDARK
jgi:hypothetical protein